MSISISQDMSIVRGMLTATFATMLVLVAGCSGADAERGDETLSPSEDSNTPAVESSQLNISCTSNSSAGCTGGGGTTASGTWYRICYGSFCLMCSSPSGGLCYVAP